MFGSTVDTIDDRSPHPPQRELFKLFEEEPGGVRPEAFAEPRPQERVQRWSSLPTSLRWCRLLLYLSDQLVAMVKHVDSAVP